MVIMGLIVLVLGSLVAVPLVILQGWVLSVMWGWFVAPTFGIAELSVPVGIGICFIASFLTRQTPNNTGKTDMEKVSEFVGFIVSPLFVLLWGYVIHSMM